MSAQATAHLNGVRATFAELDRLTRDVEAQLVALRQHTEAYANAVHVCRSNNIKPPTYSGSTAQMDADDISVRLRSAGQRVQFVSSELVRFGG